MDVGKELEQKAVTTDHADTDEALNFTDIMADRRLGCVGMRPKDPEFSENGIMRADARRTAKDLEENHELDNVDDAFAKYTEKGKSERFEKMVNDQLKKDGSELRVDVSQSSKRRGAVVDTYYNLNLTEDGKKIDEDGWKDTDFRLFTLKKSGFPEVTTPINPKK